MLEAQMQVNTVGRIIKSWRAARHISQLTLAHRAGISQKHLAFVETGRAQPSREMVVTIAEALDVPLRERNTLMVAAGYAPFYRETDFDAPEMAHIRQIIKLLLDRFEPFAAVAMDRNWSVLFANGGFEQTCEALSIQRPRVGFNLLEMFFAEGGFKEHIQNWGEVAYELIQRIHREALHEPTPSKSTELLRRLLDAQSIPAKWRILDLEKHSPLMLPIHLKVAGHDLRLFSTITTLGTPHDITLQELRIEATLPADAQTETILRNIAAARG